MTTPTDSEIRRNGNPVGERVELARHTVPVGERVLYGQRVDGVVRVTDVPAGGRGRAYLVERELEQDGYEALQALVADYLDQAALLEDVPMAVSPLTGTRSENLEGGGQRSSGFISRGRRRTTSETRSGRSRSRRRYKQKPRRSPATPVPTCSSPRIRLIAMPCAIGSSRK
jgi:hypothetical protein